MCLFTKNMFVIASGFGLQGNRLRKTPSVELFTKPVTLYLIIVPILKVCGLEEKLFLVRLVQKKLRKVVL